MKKLFSLVALATIFCLSVHAQEKGKLALSGSLAYGTKASIDDNVETAGGAGINLGLEYFVTDRISIAPSYTLFFGTTVESSDPVFNASSTLDWNLSGINLDGRYYFLTEELNVYGLFGIGIVAASFESESTVQGQTEVFEDSDSETGINIGAGLLLPLTEMIGIGAQVKYNTVEINEDGGQLVISAGLNLRF